ncbi:MAG TPA: hypothetical protein VH374_16260 [Polyangia bacterium]|jgi:hypothetical protein|nr:hypothetical protein [Polyangia bacterium]
MSKPARGSSLLAALIGASVALSLVACSKNDDAGKASGIPAPPAGSATPAPVAAPSAPAPPPAPAAEAPAPEPKPDPNAVINGTIVLAPSMKAQVKPDDVIFLVARRISDNPSARGSLVAVKRFTAAALPIPFSLGPQDMMFKNGNFEGDLAISARVDKDGDPMTHKKGDVIALLPKVAVGSRGVKLSLNQIQKEDESLIGGGGPPMMGGGRPHGPLPPGHP